MTGVSSLPVAPGPTGPDMLRALPVIRADPLAFLDQCARAFGPVTAFPVPGRPVLFVSEPALVRQVLQTNHRAYGKRTVQYDALALVTGEGLLTSDGDAWRTMRRLLQPAFHHELLDGVVTGVLGAANEISAEWAALPADAVIDLDEAMMRTTLRIVGTTLFGADLGAQAASLVAAVVSALDVVVARAQLPVRPPEWLPTPQTRALRASLRALDAAVEELVEARRGARAAGESADVLGLLLQARDEGLVTDEQVRHEVVTLIVAGHETVAATMTWTWLLLGEHPAVATAVRAEAEEVLGAAATSGTAVDHATVQRLTTARAVVDESLRLFPPAWVISRRALEPDRLGSVDVPEGSTVFASPYLLQRDPRCWSDPLTFDPARFGPGTPAAASRSGYLPFGAGPRLCIGRDLALLEAPLLLSVLAARHDVLTPPLASVPLHAGVTLRPRDGVAVSVRRRAGSP